MNIQTTIINRLSKETKLYFQDELETASNYHKLDTLNEITKHFKSSETQHCFVNYSFNKKQAKKSLNEILKILNLLFIENSKDVHTKEELQEFNENMKEWLQEMAIYFAKDEKKEQQKFDYDFKTLI